MSARDRNAGFHILDDFACEAIHAPSIPSADPSKQERNEGMAVVEDGLRGMVVRYDTPTEPVAEGDWDVLRLTGTGADMRSFFTLADAVRFLADALERGDDDALAEACHEALPPRWQLDSLREVNTATPLVGLYAGRTFPQEGTTYKLGGHVKELGHIHIDFVRCDGGWVVQQIWICR